MRGRAAGIRRPRRGQALVEFALALPIFLFLLVGVFDLGRGIFMYNGVSEAAREIARTTSVHPGIALGASTETVRTVNVQKALVPGMVDPPTYACVQIDGSAITHALPCTTGDFVKVTVQAPFRPIVFFGLGGTIALTSSSSIQIP